MRYLSLLAAILASTPVCAAEFTHTIEIRPGFAERWQAPRSFKNVHIGDSGVVDVTVESDKQLVIHKLPESREKVGGATLKQDTDVILTDEHGEVVADVLVTDPTNRCQLVRSAETGWKIYRNLDKNYQLCEEAIMNPSSTNGIVASQPDAPKQ